MLTQHRQNIAKKAGTIKSMYKSPALDTFTDPSLASIGAKLDDLKLGQAAMHKDLKIGFNKLDASFNMLTFKITDDLSMLAKDVKKTLIAHSDSKTKREYPSVYMMIPKAKPKGVFNLLSNITKVMYDIHCFCEFQFKIDDSKEGYTALWHPVETDPGQYLFLCNS